MLRILLRAMVRLCRTFASWLRSMNVELAEVALVTLLKRTERGRSMLKSATPRMRTPSLLIPIGFPFQGIHQDNRFPSADPMQLI